MSNLVGVNHRMSKAEKISSIRNQPIDKHIDNVIAMSDALSGVISNNYASASDTYRVKRWFHEVIGLLKSLQVDKLNDYEAVKIFDTIYSYLPEGGDIFLKNYSQKRGIYSSLEAAKDGKKYNYFRFLEKLVAAQIARNSKASFFSQIQQITPPSAAPLGYTKNANPHLFPNISVNEPLIGSSIASVKKLWLTASETANTVETEFFLEQTVMVYIPESYNLYLNFKNTDADLQLKAAAGFVEQMVLIQNKLSNIIETKRANDMRAVETQTVFLKSSLGVSAQNSLEKVK